ncbi:uncharacterized protein [Hoplias malabaricus]|uniref:uncharacterized protein isoform X1 n=1 Tax=Hoplias malabaricus TaxID=27720 RepID=UPI0034628536
MGNTTATLRVPDLETIYINSCALLPVDKTVIFVGTQKLEEASELFYTPVLVNGQVTVNGLLDSGSMACTISEEAVQKIRDAGVCLNSIPSLNNIVLIGCGGLTAHPKCIYELNVEICGFKFLVPVLVVPGQRDDFIIGTNVIKPIIQKMKSDEKYWTLVSSSTSDSECERLLELLSCVSRASNMESVNKVGTVKLQQAVTLLPKKEYLVWGKLPGNVSVSPGATVIVEPTTSRAGTRNILVGRVLTPMWGDHWVPMRVLNASLKPVTLRRNTKLADVSYCLAMEDLPVTQSLSRTHPVHLHLPNHHGMSLADSKQKLVDCGLDNIDIDACEVSEAWKIKLAELLVRFQDIFSKGKLDCGEAKDFVHRIHLSDDRPFRLPYRRVPPAHYHKLREVLNEMEEKDIISKSVSEYASPLVMV